MPVQRRLFLQLRHRIEDAGYQFRKISDLDFSGIQKKDLDEILAVFSETGEITELSGGFCTLTRYMEHACGRIADAFRGRERITVSEVRDLFGTGRKNAKLILEYTDRLGMTRKTGGESERTLAVFKKSKD